MALNWTRLVLTAGLAASLGAAATSVSSAGQLSNSYYGDRERGWFWYEDPPEPPKPKPRPPKPEPKAGSGEGEPKSARERLKELREEIEEAKALAILEPTPEHIAAYQKLQSKMMDRSMLFADTWRRNLWNDPELDYTTKRPVVSSGVRKQRRMEDEQIREAIAEVRNERGLFFFYRSAETCDYCDTQSMHVARFAKEHGLEVRAVSLDGSANQYFPEARPDNGIAEALGVKDAPALFLVDPETKAVDSLGYGVIDDAEIGKRIRRIVLLERGEF